MGEFISKGADVVRNPIKHSGHHLRFFLTVLSQNISSVKIKVKHKVFGFKGGTFSEPATLLVDSYDLNL